MLIISVFIENVSLICSLCLCVIVIPLNWQHTPALYGGVHTWGLQGKCHKLFSVLFCISYLQIIYM